MTRLILIAGFCAGLAGCASSGPTGKEILTGSLQPHKARLVIYRTAIMGFAVQPNYIVDGKSVAPAQPNGFVVCDIAPGKHNASVDNPSANINFGGGSEKADVTLKAGETRYIRADINPGLTIGVVTLTQVTEEQGKADTQALYKQTASCS
ncbi:MAG: DUF2846 domain-containing protein [Hyphomicrobiaceae bacterium]